MSDLASLIARLEAAEGPITDYMERRDIAEMASAAGLTTFEVADLLKALRGSLDSAILLVPEGWSWHAGTDWDDAGTVHGIASVEERAEFRDDPELRHPGHYTGRRQEAEAATPALALCLAALKARAQG